MKAEDYSRVIVPGNFSVEIFMQRFWDKVDKSKNCWQWTASQQREYGWFWFNGGGVAAHRFSWELINGEIKNGLHVLHKCHNKLCVNPDHLYLGTYQDNMADLVKRRAELMLITPKYLSGHTSIAKVRDYCKKHNLRPTIDFEKARWVLRPMLRSVK